MMNHEKAFRDMKDFYTDITKENLELIRIHRTKFEEINGRIQENKRLVDEMKENKNLEIPKAKLLEKQKELERQTAGFEKTKLSL